MKVKISQGRLLDKGYENFILQEVTFNDDLESYSIIFQEEGTQNMLEFILTKEEALKLQNYIKSEMKTEIEIEVCDYQII